MFRALTHAVFLAIVICATGAQAQNGPLGLFADAVTYDRASETLTAEGNVEVITDNAILRTDKVVYDDAAGVLTIPGSFTLQDEDGTVVTSRGALIDAGLEAGIIEGARTVIAGGITVAADRLTRPEGGRYVSLRRAVASTCRVCMEAPVPLWRIRADRVVHDTQEGIVHYDNATFEIAGVPLLYTPYFRHPDADKTRASGLLAPRISNSTFYGFGYRQPYFQTFGPSRDVTLTPFLTALGGTLLEGEYRQAFDSGELTLTGIGQVDTSLFDDDGRWFLGAEGEWRFGGGIIGELDIALVSDDGFLDDYDFSSSDRLDSRLRVSRYEDDGYWDVSTTYTTSLREDEPQATVPQVLPEFSVRRLVTRDGIAGGSLALTASGYALTREAGRDVTRLTGGLEWERGLRLSNGLSLRGFAQVDGDVFLTADDPAFPSDPVTRVRPLAGIEARFPFARRTEGATELIEPIAQIVVAGDDRSQDDIPNEDSQLGELYLNNLFAISRFPGEDTFEPGTRADLGLRYERLTDTGWLAQAAFGRIFRLDDFSSTAAVPALSGNSSDYVIELGLGFRELIRVDTRILLDEDFNSRQNETAVAWSRGYQRVSASYVQIAADGTATGVDRSEFAFDGETRLTQRWSASLEFRRDLENRRQIETGVGIAWRNDCAEVGFSVSRDYTRSATVEPSTVFALTFRLGGLGDDDDFEPSASTCAL